MTEYVDSEWYPVTLSPWPLTNDLDLWPAGAVYNTRSFNESFGEGHPLSVRDWDSHWGSDHWMVQTNSTPRRQPGQEATVPQGGKIGEVKDGAGFLITEI